MKRLILLALCFSVCCLVGAQQSTDAQEIFHPRFPEGAEGLKSFLAQHIRWADGMDLEGKVVVAFQLETDGTVSNPVVVESLHPLYDNEALRVVGLMPRWIPYLKNGECGKTGVTLPITFRFATE